MKSEFNVEKQHNRPGKGRGSYGLGLEQPISVRILVTCLCCYPITAKDSPLTHRWHSRHWSCDVRSSFAFFFVLLVSPYKCTEGRKDKKKAKFIYNGFIRSQGVKNAFVAKERRMFTSAVHRNAVWRMQKVYVCLIFVYWSCQTLNRDNNIIVL